MRCRSQVNQQSDISDLENGYIITSVWWKEWVFNMILFNLHITEKNYKLPILEKNNNLIPGDRIQFRYILLCGSLLLLPSSWHTTTSMSFNVSRSFIDWRTRKWEKRVKILGFEFQNKLWMFLTEEKVWMPQLLIYQTVCFGTHWSKLGLKFTQLIIDDNNSRLKTLGYPWKNPNLLYIPQKGTK